MFSISCLKSVEQWTVAMQQKAAEHESSVMDDLSSQVMEVQCSIDGAAGDKVLLRLLVSRNV